MNSDDIAILSVFIGIWIVVSIPDWLNWWWEWKRSRYENNNKTNTN